MVKIKCEIKKLSQRFHHFYIFRDLDFQVESGRVNLIRGANGSGKSTLLKILGTGMEAWSGEVQYSMGVKVLENSEVNQYISFVAPYQELPEELSLKELIDFQISLGNPLGFEICYGELISLFGLESQLDKPLLHFSTGMRQKARFILAFGQKRPVWILDEPGSNLDTASAEKLWHWLLARQDEHLIVLASNDPAEISRSHCVLDLEKKSYEN